VAIAASFLQTGLFWLKHRRFETMHLITLGVIAVFGGLTLMLHDDTFIKWKPRWSIGYSRRSFASQWFGKKPSSSA
jgi:intracellular septation protein